MAVFKCKMCGGSLDVQPGVTVCECDYCGTKQTLPQADDEQKLNRYNRANHFRAQCEFDKAVAAYEKLLEQDDTDAEAHWGAVISRFGIEYVEDPATKKRVPTCHRVQIASILADADYLAAVENAPDMTSRLVYKEQAAEIAAIQKDILAISANEKPYDVFICYKETDENGQRTRDSALAQEIYYGLTEQGYKVFFSRITLEDKLGRQYEPYIFAALNSARVMVAVGTKPEYFNAVWVKNEWSRYLALMANDRKRLLIPCYRDMDPYDLPEELSSLQSQDMSRIGFMQDLLRGINKVLKAEEPAKAAAVKETVVAQNASVSGNIVPLLKRGYMSLEDGNWQEADGFFEQVLNQDAENVKAYLGKLYASERVPNGAALQKKRLSGLNSIGKSTFSVSFTRDILAELDKECPNGRFLERAAAEGELNEIPRTYESSEREAAEAYSREQNYWNNSRAYCRALQFSSGTEKQELEALRDQVLTIYRQRAIACKRTVDEQRREVQSKADTRAAQVKEKYAACYAQTIDSAYMETVKTEKAASGEEQYRAAAKQYELLEDYEDAAYRAKKCLRRANALREAMLKKQRQRRFAGILAAVLFVAAAICYFFVIAPAKNYKAASALLAEERYAEAKQVFTALGRYKDSADMAKECDYQAAKALFDSGKYEEAKTAFIALETYKDSADMPIECDYQAAKALFDSGKYEEAKTAFIALETYKDSADMPIECDYQAAKALLSTGKYGEAYAAFCALKGYKDVDTLLASDENLKAAAALDAAWQPGKYVTFGRYEQDNKKSNGAEAIEWRVLAREGSKALILSKYGLDAKPYNEKLVNITWEKCTLRAWLNGAFLNTAFDGTEQARIQQTAVDNSKAQGYSKWNTDGGNDTQDKVFLLSYAEANKYLGVTKGNSKNTEARVSPTAYAKANGAWTSSDNKTAEGAYAGWWWLRSPGYYQYNASHVSTDGSFNYSSVYYDNVVVRPALWVEIS